MTQYSPNMLAYFVWLETIFVCMRTRTRELAARRDNFWVPELIEFQTDVTANLSEKKKVENMKNMSLFRRRAVGFIVVASVQLSTLIYQ